MNIDSTAQIVGGYGSAQAPAATVLGGSQGVQGSLSCSTAGGVPIQDRQQLVSHLQSDLHKYNLKRKIANLPPVTKEWFEARKAQLASMQAQGAQAAVPPGCVRLWVCPLTKKVFKTEHTYQAHTRSRKYQDVLKKAGLEQPPAPIISHKTIADTAEKQQQQQQQQQREVLHEQQQEQQQQQQVQQEQEQQQGQLEQHWHAAEGHQEPMPHPEVHGTPPEAPPGLRTSVSGSIVRHAQLGQQRQQVTEEHRGHLSQHLCTSVSGSIIRHASAQLPAAYSAQCPYSMVPASKQSEVVVRLKLDVGQLRQLTRELVRDLVDYAASILSEQLEPIKQSMHTISSGVSQAAQSVKKIADFIDKYAAAMRLKKQQEVCTLCVKVGLVLMLGAMVSSSIARGSLPFYSPLWQYKCAASQGSSWFFPKYWTAKLLGSHPLMWYPGLAVCFLVEVGSYFLALIALAVGAYVVLPHLFRDLHRAWYFVLPFCLGAAGGYAGMNLVGLMGGAPMVWLLCWELWVGLCCVMYAKEVQSISLRTGLISVISVVLPLATGYLPFHDIALS
mmetsp:Transcript_7530/g.18216  ORF Transcript_7530/g.18216 Transcript_7530/m.18216 type:complete len:557 (-) Transcript_7530:688-2358(-)